MYSKMNIVDFVSHIISGCNDAMQRDNYR